MSVLSPRPPSAIPTSLPSSSSLSVSGLAGLLGLLHENDVPLQVGALKKLNNLVDCGWAEISNALPLIESLYEDESFPARNLAALVASKVFYHLEELDDALRYALGAGDLFDVLDPSEFAQTMVARCVDRYVDSRVKQSEDRNNEVTIDDRLIVIVEKMFSRCLSRGEIRQAVGIAIESRRIDLIKDALMAARDVQEALAHCNVVAQTIVSNREFRHQILKLLVDMNLTLSKPNYIIVCQSLLFLNDAQRVADILFSLIRKGEEETMLSYQIGFDLGENQNQPFLMKVANLLTNLQKDSAEVKMDTTTSSLSDSLTTTSPSLSLPPSSTPPEEVSSRLLRLRTILSGESSTLLYLQFLFNHNKTDLNLLKQIKDKLEQRNSVTHNATVMANAILHCGTTVDSFLRDNLEWLGKAQNWAKFTATASIGVIHKGHVKESQKLLDPYLPQNGVVGTSPYQEGGALYAMGLIHSNSGVDKTQFLTEALRNAGQNEIVQHGACLGLGLAAMATGNNEVFDTLKSILSESAVAGEASALCIGLIGLGSGDGVQVEELLGYAHDSKHEKVIRGIAMAIALIEYGQEEEADVVIEQLFTDKDALLRYGGMFTIGMAYACTANNKAIQRLLHIAVSDVSDDVRRAAVTNLGFVLANVPDQVPRVVQLLAESYNPHVRYGAAIAVGIACAGGPIKARKDALAVLEPLLRDRIDFVRQGAFIGMAMVLMQHNENSEPKLGMFRKAINEAMNVKSDTMTKLGAILAAGIVDGGGRNCSIQLMSAAGHKRMATIVGLALFNQFWYWYPLVHFISLSLSPTAVIGLNKNLDIPKPFVFVSKASPSTFACPPPIDLSKAEVKKDKKVATLSTTAKAKAKAKKKEEQAKKDQGGAQDMDTSKDGEEIKANANDTSMDVDSKKDEEKEKEKDIKEDSKDVKEKESPPSTFEILSNPSRCTPLQLSYIDYPKSQRYIPVKPHLFGFVMLVDSKPNEEEQIVAEKKPQAQIPGISPDEPDPPAPFEYTGN